MGRCRAQVVEFIKIECDKCGRIFSGKNEKLVNKLTKHHKKKEHNIKGKYDDGYDIFWTSEFKEDGSGKKITQIGNFPYRQP